MYGQNPKRPPEKGDGSRLQVQHMFPTFQGEGPFIGMPAVFIRLGGCNLACSFCDTEFESFTEMQTTDVVAKAVALRPRPARRVNGEAKEVIAVVTGGEPFRQAIGPLCEQLIAEGFHPQIETNGTLYRDIPDGVSIVCSPKNNSGAGYFPPHPDIRRRVSAYKFLISAEDDGYHTVPDWLNDEHAPVYAQPIDTEDAEKNRKNYIHTAEVAEEHGLILGIQMHKYYGIE